MRRDRIIKLLLGFGVAAFFVWLILRQVDPAAVGAALSDMRPGWVVAAVTCFFLGYACRVCRWRAMLARHNPGLGWGRCAVPFFASIAGNNVLPFRAGDALRAFAFTRWLGVGTSAVLATLLVERLLDLLTLLLALGLALTLLNVASDAGALVGVGAGGLLAIAAIVAAVLLFPLVFEPPARFALRLVARLAPRIGARLEGEIGKIFAALQDLARGARMVRLVLWSLAAWSFEGAVFYCAALAIPGMTEPLAGWLAMPVGTLATLLPSTPGYVGAFHFFVIKAAEAMSNPAATAAAFAVLAHLVMWLPVTVVGGVCFGAWSLRRPAADPEATAKVQA